MKKWLFGMALLLVLTLVIRLLANYQQQSHLTQMKVAPAVLEHMGQPAAPAAPGRYGFRKSKERQEHSSSTASTRAKAGIDRRSLRAAAQPIDT